MASKSFFTDLIRKYTPTREGMAGNKYLAPMAHRFLSPELWRFTRRSVPRGVALGLFAAFIVPVGQIVLAAFMALPARANMPLAALVTFVTNPFTFPFWGFVANRIGRFMLKVDAATTGMAGADSPGGAWMWLGKFFAVAGVTAVGFVVLAIVASGAGYVIAGVTWRRMVRSRRKRQLRRLRAKRSKAAEATRG